LRLGWSNHAEKRGSGYRVATRVIDPATNGTVASESVAASDRPGVLHAIETLAARVRVALGESNTEMENVAAVETFTAGSLEAMQAYAQMIDKSLSYDDLPGLGARLKLPTGWRYEQMLPASDLVLGAHGAAIIVQDDLDNTYQKID